MRDNESIHCGIITTDAREYSIYNKNLLKVDKEIVIFKTGMASTGELVICSINNISTIKLNITYYNEDLIDKILKLMPDLAPFM